MRQIFTTAFMLLLAITAFAQHTIKGKVLDEKGNSLAGATVTVQNSSLKQSTNSDGTFVFDNLSKNRYTLVCSFVGYETVTQQAVSGKEVVIKLYSASYSINEITVRSLRASDKSPIAYTNIDKETISKSNMGQDIPYLLVQTPSFVASSDAGTGIGYTGFRIRGTDASRINVTINGIPYNDADEQGAYWVDIPDFASSIENIQVQRGVGTTTNGAAAFGANINILSNNYAQKASGELALTYGSFNTQKATVKASTGLLNKHWAFDARLSSVTSDGYIDRGWVKMHSYYLQGGYYTDNSSIKLITFGGTEQTYHAWNGVPKDSLNTHRTYNSCGYMGVDENGQPLYYTNQTDNYTQTHYQLIGAHTFNSEFSINGGLHYTRGDGYYEEYKQDQKYKKYGIASYVSGIENIETGDLVRQKTMGNDFAGAVFSLNYNKENLSAQVGGAANCYWGQHWGDVTQIKNYPINITPLEYYRNNVSKWDANLYLKINYAVLSNLFINAEAQYRRVDYSVVGKNDKWDYNTEEMQHLGIHKSFNFFNPKAGILYKINNLNECYASFAVANREPTRTNFTDASPTKLPTSERLKDYEAGYKFHNDIVSAGANMYYMDYHNQLILTGKLNEIGEPLSENVASSYRLGIEFVGAAKFSEHVSWDASLTLSQNRINNFKEYVDNWDTGDQQTYSYKSTPIAYSPSVTWNNAFTVSYGRFEAKLSEQYVGKQYLDNTGSAERSLDSYFVSNLRFAYTQPVKYLRGIDFSVIVNNLTDTKYISNGWSYSYYTGGSRYSDLGFYPQAGINLLAGITVKF
jgi:iron complex outermembrane receptor protein